MSYRLWQQVIVGEGLHVRGSEPSPRGRWLFSTRALSWKSDLGSARSVSREKASREKGRGRGGRGRDADVQQVVRPARHGRPLIYGVQPDVGGEVESRGRKRRLPAKKIGPRRMGAPSSASRTVSLSGPSNITAWLSRWRTLWLRTGFGQGSHSTGRRPSRRPPRRRRT